MSQLDEAVHVHLDGRRLAGYWSACKALTGDVDPADPHTTRYDQINGLIRAHDYQVGQDAAPQGGSGTPDVRVLNRVSLSGGHRGLREGQLVPQFAETLQTLRAQRGPLQGPARVRPQA